MTSDSQRTDGAWSDEEIAAGKAMLAELNASCDGNWPNGQQWDELAASSQQTCIRLARERQAVPVITFSSGAPPAASRPSWSTDARAHGSFISIPAPPLSIEGREEFEKYWRAKYPCTPTQYDNLGRHWYDGDRKLDEPGDYINPSTARAWEIWQASRASDRERVKELFCQQCQDKRVIEDEGQGHTCPVCDGEPITYQTVKVYSEQIDQLTIRAESAESRLSELTGLLKRVMAHGVPHARSCVMTFPATAQGLNPGATCGCGADDIRVALLSHLESSQ